jgi:UDP-N-acetylglucosamine 2-epimerase (non-hydrolysing)
MLKRSEVKMELKILRDKELENKVCVLVGTRPSIIKMGPLIKELSRKNIKYFVIHAGQHYSYNMDEIFFQELMLSKADYKLSSVKDFKLHGEQTAEMLKGIEKILIKEKPKIILVCGDANFNLAGALAARKLHINVGHVESGLRSNDWLMPEEHNRVMIDHISDFLFTPTEDARKNLINDNVKGKIFLVGNTIVDAVKQNVELAENRVYGRDIFNELGIKPKKYFLLTIHREENVDIKQNLESIFEGIKVLNKLYDFQIVLPIHPRTEMRIEQFGLRPILSEIQNLKVISPKGYFDFLLLIKNSALILTDSGGVQEEGCILKVPCVTLRDNTERPETVDVGANFIAGLKKENIVEGVNKMLNVTKDWVNPFGENVSNKIISILEKELVL